MSTKSDVRVIAIAGPPGSGKTALMAALARLLGDAAVLFLDGFETPDIRLSGADLARWLAAGARYDDFTIPGLVEALTALKAGRAAVEPASGRQVDPARLVLFEMPFGRAYGLTAGQIDFLVWLDTPLDVALARNVLAFERDPSGRPRAWLADYMTEYLAVTRAVLVAQRRTVAPGADLVLDGLAAPAAAAQKVVAALEHHGLAGAGIDT
jgi:uridine kinase